MQPLYASVSDASAGAKYSRWVRFDDWAPNYISIQCVVTGAVDYTVEYTLDDPNSPTNPVAVNDVAWFQSKDSALVGAVANAAGGFSFSPTFARIKLNSGSGTVKATFLQSFGGV